MLTAPGVVPPDGVSETHVPPRAAAVKLRVPPELSTRTVFGSGLECPDWYSKETARGGQTLSRPEPVPPVLLVVTTSLTGTVCGPFEAPFEVIVTVPL